MTPPTLLTVQQVASSLDVSKMTVYRLIEHKELVALRVGSVIRIHPGDFAAYMRNARTVPHTGGAA
jgi:excisionase family DNA binding protein